MFGSGFMQVSMKERLCPGQLGAGSGYSSTLDRTVSEKSLAMHFQLKSVCVASADGFHLDVSRAGRRFDCAGCCAERSRVDGPAQEQGVELRFFGGLNIEETAEVMAISPVTVQREWIMAKAWLYRELSGEYRDEA